MSVTSLGFLVIYFSGIVLSLFRHPRYGLYAYLFAFYMHPPDRWWRSEVPDLRWAFIAALVALVSTIRLDAETRPLSWYRTGGAKLLMAYTGWMVLQSAWAITGPFHAEGVELYAKYVVLFYLIYRLVDSEEEMRNFFLAHVLGCFYLGWLAYGKTVHGRLEGMGGPGIGDANTFGMHVSTAAIFGAALLLRGSNYLRLLMVPTLPFVLNAMILTQSRGAFVGLMGGALGVFLFKPREQRPLFYGLGALAVVLFLMLSPPDFIERIKTITKATESTEEMDGSAASRLVIIDAQFRMFEAHPLGTGHRGTRTLSPLYLDEDYLTQNRFGEGGARSSHNTLMAVLVDQGLPGLLIWLALMCWALFALIELRRLERRGMPYALATYRMSLAGALALVTLSGMFSNYFKAEITIWCLALLASLQQLGRAAVEETADSADAAREPPPTPSRARPAGARQHKPAWRQQHHG